MVPFTLWRRILVVALVLPARLSFAACPAGFVEQNNMCIQQPPTCPVNYVLNNGLCYPANQVPPTPVTQYPVATQPCNSQKPCAAAPAQPCAAAPVQPCAAAPVQPCAAAPAPCATTPVQPCAAAPAPCAAAPVQPCAAVPAQPCPAAPALPCASTPAQPCGIPSPQPCGSPPVVLPAQPPVFPPTQPCNVPPPPVYPVYPIYPTSAPNTTPPPPSIPNTVAPPINTTTTTTTTWRPPLPPDPIMRCPEGTILVNGVCRLIYCHKGIYKDNTCIQTVCPEGTVWTGIRCAMPEPIEHSITYNHTVFTNFNGTASDIVINNDNNVVVNAPIEVPIGIENAMVPPQLPPPPELPPPPAVPPPVLPKPELPPPANGPCCNVMTPRTCKQNAESGLWNCYSNRYRQCGQMCVAPTVYLRPPRIYQPQPHTIVMPPNPEFRPCGHSNACSHQTDMHDCSGCAAGFRESCSPYCYNYSRCGSRRCQFYDQQNYCSMSDHNGGVGCTANDGCYGDWCT